MFNLDNITVRQLYQIQDEELFKKYLRFSNEKDKLYLKPKGEFANHKATPIGSLTYGEVSQIKHNLSNPTFENIYECFDLVFKVKFKTYLIQDVVSYFYAINWIKDEVKKIIEREKKSFSGESDLLLEMAGVNRLVPFGELNTIIPIAHKFSKSPEEIQDWKYNLVFTIMIHDKVLNEVQTEYNKLKYGSKNQA